MQINAKIYSQHLLLQLFLYYISISPVLLNYILIYSYYIFDNLYDISKPEENVDEMLRSEELKPYINKFYKFLTNEKN